MPSEPWFVVGLDNSSVTSWHTTSALESAVLTARSASAKAPDAARAQ